ncbi:MAG: hypothetical protein CFE34_00365 [Rhodobacteraceae bacterium PARR1]|nr:MAG: hypothetical protein CFE34_00365 [Rhodobacteraceae bacterium PARR1]
MIVRALWATGGAVALALGAVGIVTPLLPTVPFMLLAAFCFARSSQRLHDWLIHHPKLGPPIRDWQRSGAISPKAKRLATLSIAAAFGVSVLLALPLWVLAVQAAVLAAVLVFIWRRPDA